jgi:DNA-directed RNA polymerase specialized sigma24 family protein
VNNTLLPQYVFKALINGDSQARDEFHMAYFPLLYKNAMEVFNDPTIADKLANKVLEEFYKQLGEFTSERAAKNYLFMKLRDTIDFTTRYQAANN